jgi:hypothetical protein
MAMTETNANARFEEQVNFDRRNARAGIIGFITIVCVLVIVSFVVGIYWLYTVTYERVEHDQYSGVASKELIAIHEREDEQLHKYGYINKDKGVVRLPVERAMELVAAEAGQGKFNWNTKSYPAQPELPGGAAGMNWKPDGTGSAGTAANLQPKGAPAK